MGGAQGCGGAAAPASRESVGSAPPRAPFLWRVESPDGGVSHLMGTIHGAVTLDEALPAPHDALLHTAEAVYVESLIDDPAQIAVLSRRMLEPSPVPLSQRTGAATFDALSALLPHFPRERLDTLRPWAAFFIVFAVRLSQSLETHAAQSGDGPATPAMDTVILQQTRARDVVPRALEEMSELADLFDALDEAIYLQMLVELSEPVSPETGDPAVEQLDDLAQAYRAGDLEAMAGLVDELGAGEGTSTFFGMLFVERNRLWMPRLERAFATGGAFVAVGAGHLPGAGGLLEQLSAAGFVITRL